MTIGSLSGCPGCILYLSDALSSYKLPGEFEKYLHRKNYQKSIKRIAPYLAEITRFHCPDSHMNSLNKLKNMIINKYGDSREYLKHGVITTMELAELYIHMTRVFNSALPGYKESSESALLEMKDKTICITKSPSQMYEIILQHLLSTFMSEVTELHRNHKNCSSYLPIYRFDFT